MAGDSLMINKAIELVEQLLHDHKDEATPAEGDDAVIEEALDSFTHGDYETACTEEELKRISDRQKQADAVLARFRQRRAKEEAMRREVLDVADAIEQVHDDPGSNYPKLVKDIAERLRKAVAGE